jgi:FkbM family methyltransferase
MKRLRFLTVKILFLFNQSNMLLNFSFLVKKYSIKADGVIVCGAHFGEEHPDYVAAGIKRFVYIEPVASTFNVLKNKFGAHHHIKLFNYACGDFEGEQVMYTGSQNEGQSNSLLKMDKHLKIHPGITLPDTELVTVRRLDSLGLAHKGYQLLVMDCQGFENRVLKGATETLKQMNYVYTELNKTSVYHGCALVDEMDELLHEFKRVETGAWVGDAWTDAFYVRRTLLLNE